MGDDVTLDTVGDSPTVDPNVSDAWSGLDDLGSGVSNVANSILGAASNLVTAQINSKVAQTTNQTRVRATNALPLNNPNAWQHYVLIGGLLLVAVLIVIEVKKRG